MRYRSMTASGDYVFGSGSSFLVNTPAAVAQAISTRLKLFAGEWFLDKREGLDLDNILGYGTQSTRDHEVQQRILNTPGVLKLLSYSSSIVNRGFTVACTVDTIYGTAQLNEVIR